MQWIWLLHVYMCLGSIPWVLLLVKLQIGSLISSPTSLKNQKWSEYVINYTFFDGRNKRTYICELVVHVLHCCYAVLSVYVILDI